MLQILAHLEAELESLSTSAKVAALAATHEESRPENKYDTRGLEASYLAGAQAARATELQAAIVQLKKLVIREFGKDDPIGPSALIEVEHQNRRTLYFLVTVGAGLTLQQVARKVFSITVGSPLGQCLLGKVVGDIFILESAQGPKEYEILQVW